MIPLFKMNHFLSRAPGFSLVEILLALALMGFVCLSVTNFLVKGNATSSSVSARFKEASEIHSLIMDIQKDLAQGAYISPNSHKYRLEYTTYDNTGAAVKKIYRITTISSITYLQLSTDGGTTWGSPYRISAYTQYRFSGTPLFLYAHDANNCTSFTDTNANGVWQTGVDAAGVTYSCGTYTTTSPVLTSPSQATKVVLSGFSFTTGSGSPEAIRGLPTNIFMLSPQGVVNSTATAVAGVKDSPLVNSFVTNTANSRFGTAFDIRNVRWDGSHDRLFVVGHHTTGSACKIFQSERNGVLIGPGLSIADTTVQLNGVALGADAQTVLALDDANTKVYWYNINAQTPLVPIQTFNLANPSTGTPVLVGTSNLVSSPLGIAYDPNTPTDFYIVGTDPADSGLKIFEINSTTGALTGTALTLPGAFDVSHPPGGLIIEPTTGDYLVPRNYVSGSAPNQTIDIYRITRAGVATSFSVNISDLSSTATGVTGNWGMAYDPETNHLFFADTATEMVYEVYPSLIITPRS